MQIFNLGNAVVDLAKAAIESFYSKDTKEAEWNAYQKRVKEENGFKHCTPDKLKLDGRYTKILKAFAELYGLVHAIEWSKTTFGLGLEVSVSVKNKWYHSSLDVFEEGQVAYVSSMREYTQDAIEDTIEHFSKKIVVGLFGERRWIKSMNGGDCLRFAEEGKFEPVPRFEIHDLPTTEEALLLKLGLAGIDWQKCKIQLKKSRYYD